MSKIDFNQICAEAPEKTALEDFQGLFKAEIIITPRDEVMAKIKEATREMTDSLSGEKEKRLDNERLRQYLATRILSFEGLTLQTALTLCGKKLPEEMEKQADEELQADPATIITFCKKVQNFEIWLLSKLKTLGLESAKREAEQKGN